jgi:hypothetical protein
LRLSGMGALRFVNIARKSGIVNSSASASGPAESCFNCSAAPQPRSRALSPQNLIAFVLLIPLGIVG